MLKEKTLFGTIDKVKESIQFLKDMEPPEGYYLAFSGGKDSVVIKALADMAGVKYDAHYSVTTIDPPDLVYFIKREHPDVTFLLPKEPLLKKLSYKGFPTRHVRWCCELYKENGGSGRHVMTGVRRAESVKRSKRRAVEACYKDTTKHYINPIISWTEKEVWEFINVYKLPYCKLYDEGFTRIGCLMCPMAKHEARQREMMRYPKITEQFRRAFRRLYENGVRRELPAILKYGSGDEMFNYWMSDRRGSEDPDQEVLFE